MKQMRVFVSGIVQGVGFRQFVAYEAKKLQLSGWVKNISDGRVESVFIGESSNVDKMLEICKQGAPLSKVLQVESNKEIVDTNLLGEFKVQ